MFKLQNRFKKLAGILFENKDEESEKHETPEVGVITDKEQMIATAPDEHDGYQYYPSAMDNIIRKVSEALLSEGPYDDSFPNELSAEEDQALYEVQNLDVDLMKRFANPESYERENNFMEMVHLEPSQIINFLKQEMENASEDEIVAGYGFGIIAELFDHSLSSSRQDPYEEFVKELVENETSAYDVFEQMEKDEILYSKVQEKIKEARDSLTKQCSEEEGRKIWELLNKVVSGEYNSQPQDLQPNPVGEFRENVNRLMELAGINEGLDPSGDVQMNHEVYHYLNPQELPQSAEAVIDLIGDAEIHAVFMKKDGSLREVFGIADPTGADRFVNSNKVNMIDLVKEAQGDPRPYCMLDVDTLSVLGIKKSDLSKANLPESNAGIFEAVEEVLSEDGDGGGDVGGFDGGDFFTGSSLGDPGYIEQEDEDEEAENRRNVFAPFGSYGRYMNQSPVGRTAPGPRRAGFQVSNKKPGRS